MATEKSGAVPPSLGFQGPAGYQGQQGPYTGQQSSYSATGFPTGAQAAMYASGNGEDGVVYVASEEEKENLLKLLKSDYNQEYADSGEPPQNFVREIDAAVRFANYPKWQKLLAAAEQVHRARVHPAQWIQADLRILDLKQLTMGGSLLFDVLLIDPPWEEYVHRTPGSSPTQANSWTLDELKALPINEIAENPSFLFLWAGDCHLEEARELLQHWGFRRCEDITWLKTVPHLAQRPGAGIDSVLATARLNGVTPDGVGGFDTSNGFRKSMVTQRNENVIDKLRRVIDWSREESQAAFPLVLGVEEENSITRHVKEHCLVGLKGAVRRSSDNHLVHANIDTDVVVADVAVGYDQGDDLISTRKPAEVYDIIERFALGRRKLELFARTRNIRPGWLSIGRDIFDDQHELSYNCSKTFDNSYGPAIMAREGSMLSSNPPVKYQEPGVYNAKFNHAEYASWFADYNSSDSGAWNPGALDPEAEKYLVSQSGGIAQNLMRGQGLDSGQLREEYPMDNLNAYPFVKNYVGGRYEGTSAVLEGLRPKSPPQRPTYADRSV